MAARHPDWMKSKRYGRGADRFSLADVWARDNGLCQICLASVDESLVYPHPQSYVIDHKFPAIRGGETKLDNVRLAHAECNWKKNNIVTRDADDVASGRKRMVNFALRLDEETHSRLKAVASVSEWSMNSLAREAISSYVDTLEGEYDFRAAQATLDSQDLVSSCAPTLWGRGSNDYYESRRTAFADSILSLTKSITQSDSYRAAIEALAGPLPQEKQDDLQEEDSGD